MSDKQFDLVNKRFPDRLTARGEEILDPKPLSLSAHIRPLSLEQMIHRFEAVSYLRRQRLMEELDLGEDDFDVDDNPPEGVSPYEVPFMPQTKSLMERYTGKKSDKKKKGASSEGPPRGKGEEAPLPSDEAPEGSSEEDN